MIYGGVIHNRCHRLCVFFCQATDGRREERKKGEIEAPGWRSCKLMERQVRAATLDNFRAVRFMAVVKKEKEKEKSRLGQRRVGTRRSEKNFATVSSARKGTNRDFGGTWKQRFFLFLISFIFFLRKHYLNSS